MKHLSPRSYPWIVLAVAVAIRVWTLLDALRAPFWKVPLVDELAYLQTAARILQHQPPPLGAYYTAPGYAWILGAVLALGLDPQIVKFTQLLVGIASAWMVYRLTARWFSPREGLVAGLLWALYPSALFHELLLLKPTFTVALVVGALLLMSSVPRDGLGGKERWSRTVGAGLLLGLATLLRGETLLVGLILAGVLARTLRRRRLAWTVALGLLAGQAAVVAVPTALNLARGAGPVVVAYSGGVNFYIGNHPGADGGYLPLIPDRSDARVEERDAVELARRRMGRPLDAAAVSRFWSEEGLRFWREHPGDAVALTVRKLALLWSPQEIADVLSRRLASRWVRSLRNPVIGGGLVLPLALVGLVLSWRRRQAWLARGYLLASEAALVPFFLFERFRLPMIAGAVVPLAAHAVVRAWDAARSRQWKGLVTAVLATAVVGAALSIVQLICTFVIMSVYTRLQARAAVPLNLRPAAATQQRPGTWRARLIVWLSIGGLLLLLLTPLLSLVGRSFTLEGQPTVRYYEALFTNPTQSYFYTPPAEAIRNSLLVAGATVTLAVALGLVSAYLLVGPPNLAQAVLDPLLMLPLGASAVTLGLGYIRALDQPPLNLRASPLLLPLAHTLVAFPFVVRSLLPALRGMNPHWREAAGVLGASPPRIVREIELPIVSRALLVGAVFAFTISMGEFGATLLLARPDFPTMPIVIYRLLGAQGALNQGQGLAMSSLLMLVCTVGFILIERFRLGEIGEF